MFKLFHYDISEYQLLQDKLNNLSTKGYTTNKISYITHFKKTNQTTYYLVDIYTANNNKDRSSLKKYVKYYLDNNYELISTFNNILVFKGHTKLKPRTNYKPIVQKEKSKRLFHFLLSLLLLFLILLFIIAPLQPYHLLTNGNILYYFTILLIPFAFVYRTFLRWSGIYHLSKAINSKKIYKLKNNKIYYSISTLIPFFIIISLIISPLIDLRNTKQVDNIPSYIYTLKDFNIENESTYKIHKKTSLIVPVTYEYVETSNDNKYSIIVQSYKLLNEKNVDVILKEFLTSPNILYMDSIKEISSNEYIGYYDDKAYIKIITDDNMLTLINTNFEIK